MESKSFAVAALLVVFASLLITSSTCTPLPKERDLEETSNLLKLPLSPGSEARMSNGKIQRQGRFYMGYPYHGGVGFGGATASASASASASAGGMGMGYGGYPFGGMYG